MAEFMNVSDGFSLKSSRCFFNVILIICMISLFMVILKTFTFVSHYIE